jgi:hypothetical protein
VLLEFQCRTRLFSPLWSTSSLVRKRGNLPIKLPDGPAAAEGLCLIVMPGFGVRDGDQPHISETMTTGTAAIAGRTAAFAPGFSPRNHDRAAPASPAKDA